MRFPRRLVLATSFAAATLLAAVAPLGAQQPAGKDPAGTDTSKVAKNAADTSGKATSSADTTKKAAPAAPRALSAEAAMALNLTVSGVVYGQYQYLLSDGAAHNNAFDITRSYLNVVGNFGAGVTTRVTPDIYRPTSTSALAFRLKYAYVQWRPNGTAPVDFRFGLSMTPWLDWEEALWGYRMQGAMFLDRAGYMTSSDYGLSIDLFSHTQAVNGQFSVVNGEGYGNAPGGQFKDFQGRASVRLLNSDDMSRVGGLRLNAYAQLGRFDSTGFARRRWIGGASYKSKLVTLVGEYALLTNGTDTTDINGNGLSAYGVLNIPRSRVALLARVDRIDPNKDVGNNTFTTFIGGLSYRISPNLRVLGDLDLTHYQGTPSASARASRQKAFFQTEIVF